MIHCRRYYGLLLLCTATVTYAQKTDRHQFVQKPSLGFTIAADMHMQHHRLFIDRPELAQNFINQFAAQRIVNPAPGFGISFLYPFTKYLSTEIGLQHTRQRYESVFFNYTARAVPMNTPIPQQRQITQQANFIDIPVRVNFTLTQSSIQYLFGVGVVHHYLLNHHTTTTIRSQNGTEQIRVNHPTKHRFSTSPMLSMGAQWKLSDRLSIRTESAFKYLRLVDQRVFKSTYTTISLQASLFYQL